MRLALFLSTQRCRWIKSNESWGFGSFCGEFGHLIGIYPIKSHEFPLLGASHWNSSNEGAKVPPSIEISPLANHNKTS